MIGIMAAILASLHMQTADDLFGGPEGSPRTDRLIEASIQWAERIMEKIDNVHAAKGDGIDASMVVENNSASKHPPS